MVGKKAADGSTPNLGGTHLRRVRRMLWVFSILMLLLGAAWGVFFGMRGDWAIVTLDFVLLACGVLGFVLRKWGRTRSASLLLLGALFFVICVFAAVFDLPSAQAPRSTHQYLLALVIFSFVLLRGEGVWLQRGVALVCFAAFLFFASTDIGFQTRYALPDSIRIPGAWITNVCALGMLYLSLHIMQADFSSPVAMEAELRQALSEHQFLLYYQPLIEGRQGRIIGAEALVRWQHPVRGLVLPAEFIPLSEQTNLILPLGHWVLEAACRQLVKWSTQPETSEFTLSVNVSAQQLRQPDFVSQVLSAVEKTGADATHLKLEITESLLVNDVEDIITKMTILKARGIGFSLDDFGTGYSSLSYLKRLPLDQLKIDRSFVRDVLTGAHDAAIVRTVVALGQSLDLVVIAEGVETEGQWEFLSRQGCHACQGNLFSRPLPVAEFDVFVQGKRGTGASEAWTAGWRFTDAGVNRRTQTTPPALREVSERRTGRKGSASQ